MSFVKNTSRNYLLLAIIAIAFLLRVNNLTVGFPMLFISNDEAIYHQSALNMLAQRTPFTLGNYGPLGAYVQIPFLVISFVVLFVTGKVDSLSQMEYLLVTQEGYLLFIPRVISAMFGSLSILVTYKLAFAIFADRKAALWASFLAAVSFNLVHISHLARAWSPAIFFSLLATLFAVKSIGKKNDEFKNILTAYLFAAVSFGFHQISGVVIVLILLIRFLGKGSSSSLSFFRKDLKGFLAWLCLVIFFNYLSLGGNFFKLVGPANTSFLLRIPQDSGNFFDLISKVIKNGAFEKVFKDAILSDGLMIILGVFFFLKKRGRQVFGAFSIFIIFNTLLVIFVFYPFLRYTFVAIALMPIFAGRVVSLITKKISRSFVFSGVIILVTSFNAIYWNFLILREATFDQLRTWVDKNINPQTPIAATTRRNIGYVPSASASGPIRSFRPGYYKRASILAGDSYPYNVRNVVYLEAFGRDSKAKNLEVALTSYPVTYVIDSYWESKERLLNQYQESSLELVAHFSPTGNVIYNKRIPETFVDAAYIFPLFVVDRAGPYFDVLKIK